MAAKLAIYFSNQAHSPHKLRGREWGLRVMRLHPWHTTLTLMGATRPASVRRMYTLTLLRLKLISLPISFTDAGRVAPISACVFCSAFQAT